MRKKIDLILHGARGGEENMALDRQALTRAEGGEASLRIYAWDRPTVTLGKNQRPEDVASLFPNLPIVHRPSGGGAVLHGYDVTVALAIPLGMLDVPPRALRQTYGKLVGYLGSALNNCELRCGESKLLPGKRTANCFGSVGAADLVMPSTGKKVVGCALAATRTAALLHASIPVNPVPTNLGLAPEVQLSFTNEPWHERWFMKSLTAELREAGPFEVRLVSLDSALHAATRADAVLWNVLDPLEVNGSIGLVGEYDRYIPAFEKSETIEQVEEALGLLSSGTGMDLNSNTQTMRAMLNGF